ncbi:MAG: large conductance mechanosensitive channel protein MscL [Erysipelotrichales bacterium]|nr:large conductance mechanosensitive channel protein MscL [Erysipelotrichales bacterium]
MKKIFKEFGDFIKRGNVLDLAVGMIVGTAFNAIVKSLVNDIIMPVIGVILKVNVSDAKAILVPALVETVNGVETIITPAVTINYGSFIQAIIDFLIISFSVFIAIKTIVSVRKRFDELKRKEEQVIEVKQEAKITKEEEILIEIRDILKDSKKEVD